MPRLDRRASRAATEGIFRQAEQARPRIALLRPRRDGTHLDEAEAPAEQRVRHFGILVEAGGEADGIGEIPAPEPRREDRVLGRLTARTVPGAERRQGHLMRPLGR
jgi:hypothetical protein